MTLGWRELRHVPSCLRIASLPERWESMRGAFATRPGSQVDNLRVLLVDNVKTTGATLDARDPAAAGLSQVGGWTNGGPLGDTA
jgi:hypothetical protein